MTPIQVLLADDHTIVLEGLRSILRAHPEIHVCGDVHNGEEVMRFLQHTSVDVVILDIRMPVMDGLTCARKMRELHPQIKIIILTMYAAKSFLDQILKIGVHGCILKSHTGEELKAAILRVMAGKAYYDGVQAIQPLDENTTQLNFTRREIEIIKLIADGLTNIQMADHLFIAEHTVKTHRKNIMRKIGVHSTAQLIQYARQNQIV